MATEVNLPALGESVTEGTVTRWLKSVGDSVAVDEPLLEVSTDKVDTEIPSPVAGTLLEIKAEEDDTVEVGAVLAVIGDEGEGGGSDDSADDTAEPEAQPKDDAEAEKKAEQEEEIADETGDLPPGDETPEKEKSDSPAASSGGGSSSGGGGGGTAVTLPALGESVTEGTVTRWLKSVGDEVAVDEPLLEVSTDKVDTEIPSPVAGTLLEIKADEDETVEVGAELAIIGDKGAAPSSSSEEKPAEPEAEPEAAEPSPAEETTKPTQPTDEGEAETEQPEPEKDHEQAEETAPAPSSQSPSTGERSSSDSGSRDKEQARSEKTPDGSGYVTPLVRKLAAQHDVDLSTVEGTGVGGRIRKQDVLEAAAKAKESQQAPAQPAAQQAPAAGQQQAPSVTPSPLRGTTEKISRLRKIIAERMVDSLQTGAQLTQVIEVDVTNIARLRDASKADFQAREGVKLSYLPFFAKAAIDALKQHPKLNAGIDTDAGEITYYDRENLAIAVDTEKGLITPVIKDAGDLSIAGLAKKIADVAQRTRTNKIGPDELSGGTFTITNLGSVGALWDTPIINKPQVAILGPGAVVKRPVVIDDPNLGETIAVRHMVYLALTYDHRLVDGADAGRFLQDVKKRLEAGVFDV
ncbi:2-oxoglutarate dehydrogenase, E2 component, dihydrolipoamide succinyltransferase [Nocardioides abyssi]|uniref:Dihydrolipoamide acetyltransferase component of pyruvate dehydrogenase complex n=1 Tax=Nocardioides abyssi TaxID=3058370 RepID=A0ABT8EUF9_9ACTN|nr:2-oxoglutarate dehydrogenase, E2 component, dihydrolipoamide succinyltransferase [Nocardioides abyssi]MDN4161729.1 2-oxoglutarate dehydrogenase, E2 component, dihydrolipoamide succinyltransferase [Nocardioides abyssi]